MKILAKKSFIDVIGIIWLPPVLCSKRIDLSNYDIKNMVNDEGTITRDDVEEWLYTHTGDFQSITDFSASIELGDDTLDFEWTNEELVCDLED